MKRRAGESKAPVHPRGHRPVDNGARQSASEPREMEEQHAVTMLETIPDAVMNLDESFRVLYANKEAERALEKKRAAIMGGVLWETVPRTGGGKFEKEVRRSVGQGKSAEFEGPFVREGEHYQFLISPCESGAMVFIREETEKRRLRHALQESEAWKRLIVDSVKEFAIFSMDPTGRITLWNPGAEQMFGYTAKEMLGQRSDIIFVPEDREARMPAKELAEARERKHAKDERWHVRKDGTRFFVSGAVVPLYDGGGKLVGYTKVARDITKQKTAKDQLEEEVGKRTAELQKTVSELEAFSYSISHDLRAPLRSMRSFAQILVRTTRDKLDPKAADYLDRIMAGAERLDRLIQDVLTYSRVGRGNMELEPVELENLVRTIIREHPSLEAAQGRIILKEPLHNVRAHKASLSQCISNLLTNAVKFIPPGRTPRVQVRTEANNSIVRLWVEDNGIGIPEIHRERIFGMFQRTPEAEKYEGTGIGLAIVRRAVEAMGGHAGVESEPGQGSRFWVELPAA